MVMSAAVEANRSRMKEGMVDLVADGNGRRDGRSLARNAEPCNVGGGRGYEILRRYWGDLVSTSSIWKVQLGLATEELLRRAIVGNRRFPL